MTFLCPNCSTSGTLKITNAIELPPDSRSDEIALQIITCGSCGFSGIAIYEESRRGFLGEESVDHYGYHVDPNDLKELKKGIKRCPRPRKKRCLCTTHRQLAQTDKSGRWIGLANIQLGRRFVMRFS